MYDGGTMRRAFTLIEVLVVTGVIALLIAQRPELGHDDLARLLATSRSAGEESINACRALASLLEFEDSAVIQEAPRVSF